MSALLTPKQVAQQLAVSPRTVYAWIADGRLPHVRLSERVTRVPAEAVDALIAANSQPATIGLLAAEDRAAYGRAAAVDARTPSERRWALLREHREELLAIADRNRAGNLRVFGSVARGDATEESDIDILVDLRPHASLFDLGGMNFEMGELLGVKVDVVPARSVKELIRARVMSEAVPL